MGGKTPAQRILKKRPSCYRETVRTSAIMDLASGFAIVPLIMGIMKLQLLGTEPVREYFNAAPRS